MRIANLKSSPSFVEKMGQTTEAKRGFIEQRKLRRLATLPEILHACNSRKEATPPALSCEELRVEVGKHFPEGSEAWEALDWATLLATLEFCSSVKLDSIKEGTVAFQSNCAEEYIGLVRKSLDEEYLEKFDEVEHYLVELTAAGFSKPRQVEEMFDKAHAVRLSTMVGREVDDNSPDNLIEVGQIIMALPLAAKEIVQSMDDLRKEIEDAGLAVPTCLLPKQAAEQSTTEPVVTVATPEPGHLQVIVEKTVKGEPLPFPVGKKSPAERLVEMNNLRRKSHKSNK